MIDPFEYAAGWIHEHFLIQLLYHFDMMEWDDVAFGWIYFALYGVAQVVVTLAICLPLERWRPLERWPDQRAVGVDILYTLLSRVGVLPFVTFVLFYQVQVWLSGFLTDRGYVPPTLEGLFPFLFGHQILTFIIYALVLDFFDYWRHRLSHVFDWWYGLHSLHHAQQQMTFWSDDRNHVLDDLIGFVWFLTIGIAIGIPPMQFPLLVLLLRFLESLSHANARLSFGWLGERLLVSPRFHRAHHGLRAAGYNSCNYGAIFPCWDMLFRTADFSSEFVQTGDSSAEEALVTGTWWEQQRAGLRRMWRMLRRRRAPEVISG